MSIHIRMKEAHEGLRVGEDACVSGELAKQLQADGKAWITGGDPQDFETYGLEADTEVPEARSYPPAITLVNIEKD